MKDPERILSRVRIAAPCPANWDNMEGDDRTRYCALCRLNVYDLSNMSSTDAARLVFETEGRLCVRFYRRRDGTILTSDCPIGIRAIRRRLAFALACALALFSTALAGASSLSRGGPQSTRASSMLADARNRIRQTEPFKTVLEWIDPPSAMPASPITGSMAMGAIACPPPVSTNPPGVSNRAGGRS